MLGKVVSFIFHFLFQFNLKTKVFLRRMEFFRDFFLCLANLNLVKWSSWWVKSLRICQRRYLSTFETKKKPITRSSSHETRSSSHENGKPQKVYVHLRKRKAYVCRNVVIEIVKGMILPRLHLCNLKDVDDHGAPQRPAVYPLIILICYCSIIHLHKLIKQINNHLHLLWLSISYEC